MEFIVQIDVPVGEGWVAEMSWQEGQLLAGPSQMLIRPADPDNPPQGGISQTLLREIPFRQAVETARASAAIRSDIPSPQESADILRSIDCRKLTPQYLAHLSNTYVGVSAGLFGVEAAEQPLDYLCEIVEKNYGAMKNNLHTAGLRGYLLRSPGRSGGTLTGKCAKELRETYS